MTHKDVILNGGADDYPTDIRSGSGAPPAAVYTHSPATESIGELSTRVYGFNTKGARDMLRRANSSLDGMVRIPLS